MALFVAFWPAPARADVAKAQCIEANTKGQDLRRDGKLSAAREQLRACNDPACPPIVRVDCTKRLDELEGAQPTIIFDAKDGSGHDISAVGVTIDDHPFADKLDGTALPADPGTHVFVFTVPGQTPVRQTFILKEGEKERRERLVIGPLPLATAQQPLLKNAPPSSSGAGHATPAGGMGSQKLVGLVAGGVGVGGLAAGAVFAAMTASKSAQQKTDCASATACANYAQAVSDHSAGATDHTISTVALIAGGALLLGGVVILLTAPSSSRQPPDTGISLLPAAAPGGGGVFVKGVF